MKFRVLDIVRTPQGSIAMVTQVDPPRNGHPVKYSIDFFGDALRAHNSWWEDDDGLEYIDNLPRVLSASMCCAGNHEYAGQAFARNQT